MLHATNDEGRWPAGKGEAVGRIRAHDWAATSLGPLPGWPQSLRTAVDIMLASPNPVAILWGPDGVLLFNDAYAPIAAPDAFGRPGGEAVPRPLLDRALAGETVVVGAGPLPVRTPEGVAETSVFAATLLPLRDEAGDVRGVLHMLAAVDAQAPAASREEGARLSCVLDGMQEGFSLLAPDFTILEHSLGSGRIDGRTRAAVVGRSYWEAHPGSEDSAVGRALKRAMADRRPLSLEQSRMREGGGTEWLDMRALPAPGGALAVFWRDVTDRKRGEERLRVSETRYRTLFELIDSGFCVVEVDLGPAGGRTDYRVVEANPAFYEQTGFPPAVLGRWLREAVPDLEEHWFETYGRVARTGAPEHFEQGSAALGRWFDVSAFRIGEPDERGVAILFNDISARRNAEERLRELNETLEAQVAARSAERDHLWNLSQDMLARADYGGMMTAVSPAWTQVLGWSEPELLARGYATFMHEDDMPPTLEAISRMAEQRRPTRFENRIATSDGAWKHIEWTVAPEPDGVNFIAVGRDLSHAKAREAELEAAQEALRQSQKMEAVGQLTGGLAHDFNNLLAGISGSLDMMQTRIRQGRTGEIERYMVGAQGAAKRAAALTHRLLAFSRRQTLEPKPTDVNRLVAGMEDLIRRTVGPQVSVETDGRGDLWPTLVDPNQLENALLNLCINARDAMPDGGRITIATDNRRLDERTARERDLPPGHYVSMCVSDTGTGMTQDVLERAFDPFFTTKPIGVGTGLGLSMIYGFARQSGGQVRIETEVGRGTVVCLYLPRHDAAEVAEAPAGPEAAPAAGLRKTVLVVDDEPLVRMLVVDVVEELGLVALEAEDGPRALVILRSDAAIDLLVTDVGLPNGMNGRQVADAARELRRELRVLFVTGYAESAVLGHGHLEPGMQIVTKPFDMGALSNRIQAMLGELDG